MDDLKRTVLFTWHKNNGARLVPFAGWEMPLQYPRGPIEEHHLVRRSAGLFDISHMGRFEVSGAGAAAFLEEIVTSRIGDLAEYGSRYGLLCREDGGVLDDVFVYRLPEGRFLVVVNASNREKDLAWIRRHIHAEAGAAEIRDISDETAMIALQGPRALELLASAAGGAASDPPERFFAASISLAGADCLVGRTGYTGEDGVEIFVPRDGAVTVWETLLGAGRAAGIEAGPVGLAARDSLRFEPGFALYGHELSEDVTPVEAGLMWACDLSKRFTGRDAVAARKAEGAERRLVTFVMEDRGVPREGYAVIDEEGAPAGRVVSGMFAPTLEVFAGNAYLRPDLAQAGKTFYIVIRDAKKKAVSRKRPLYVPVYRKERP